MKSSSDSAINLPNDFLSKMANLLGDDFEGFRASFDQPPIIGLRINPLKISPQAYSSISPYKLHPIPWCSAGFIIDGLLGTTQFLPPGKHPHHPAGLFYIQEPSAMAAVEILSPQPGEKVLDLAAAPGGKSTHLAAHMNNDGLLVANEIHPKRVWDLAQNLERCGVRNAMITNETPQRLAEHFGDFFDRVILDAPCSGEGMFRKSESARRDWQVSTPKSCALRQGNILAQAAQMVRVGGKLVYSTCTFSPEENEAVIDAFLSAHPDFGLADILFKPGYQPAKPEWIGLPGTNHLRRAVRIWPHLAQADGHFIALLVKNGSAPVEGVTKNQYDHSFFTRTEEQITPDALALLDDFCKKHLTILFEKSRLKLEGSYIYLLPHECPTYKGIRTISPGWWLGSIKKNRFIPSHALAMGIQTNQCKQSISFQQSDSQIGAYLSGQSFINRGEDGWLLVCVDGFPLGWGKRVQNVIKNYYPHGLRWYS
jgi:NOL1/NOP2/sun family putative RNA methylase